MSSNLGQRSDALYDLRRGSQIGGSNKGSKTGQIGGVGGYPPLGVPWEGGSREAWHSLVTILGFLRVWGGIPLKRVKNRVLGVPPYPPKSDEKGLPSSV